MKRDSCQAMQANTEENSGFPQSDRRNLRFMVNNQARFWLIVCILETMRQVSDPFLNALSVSSLAVCAAILAFWGIDTLTGSPDFAALAGAVAGGGLLGRLKRRASYPQG